MFKCTHYDICMENYGFCEKNHDRCETYGDCDYCQYRLTCKQTLVINVRITKYAANTAKPITTAIIAETIYFAKRA